MERVYPRLARAVPLTGLSVRLVDLPGSGIETVASGPAVQDRKRAAPRTDATASRMLPVVDWCRTGRPVATRAAIDAQGLTPLLPPSLPAGEVVLLPLRPGGDDRSPEGALVAVVPGRAPVSRGSRELIEGLAEPFAAALANDRRIREMRTLREAAEAETRALLTRLGRPGIGDVIIGAQAGLRSVMERVELVARSDAPVLIFGETGSGKEVIARAIHSRSPRSAGPLIRVNCGAIPPELVDSELFGHERGSFTGATGTRQGWFERADGGTLFLDEIGELPLAAQVRLLRILQDGTFERVGGHSSLTVHVRLVAATHRDLPAMVREGRFREDLWYRICVFPVHLPPLRERAEDIAPMARHFALKAARRLGLAPVAPAPADLDLLRAYAWPGNVRELASVMERAAILGEGERLEVAKALGGVALEARTASPTLPVAEPAPAPLGEQTLDDAIVRTIEKALRASLGRIEGPFGAARRLGVNPHTLRARMRRLGIDWKKHRPRAGL
jgi:transcriptional regulator with GAF, ATPase, and Fis domain